ncbi:hypothetical protein SNOG_05246 [Parastagonospora nodorum SN15]|uniref:Uncharacterized protein n=1 Tax=Phaeosphaeria nodorum (strain SN15 / ATCC MYA-4574 / FGSC 10173) TaxID=321614 RepID=Q0USL8_PHANO|nr:hypothetical protein SNOG_05246 [Parastagonospora nodorum SN15]EAT87637.2 hypothetical protein SNOG_05246 [Parastagonospora nodorum SN15]
MKWSTITTLSLLAGSALGAPVSSTTAGLQISDELRNQGDGSYIATRNENGELDVKFTPMAALVARDPDLVPETPPATHSGRWSVGKDEIVCDPGHSDNVADLDAANVQLAKNAPNGKNGESEGLYGWVHLNGQTSYWCNYEVNHPTYDLVINMHVALSLKCGGSAAYGYNHYVLRRGARDLVVGRTYTGNKFCEKHFYSSPKQLEERDPAPKNFTIAKSLMQQGNGLYLATFDDSGKASVEFTPAAQLPAINSTIPAINGTLTTENPTVMSIRALRKRGEVHCDRKDSMNTGDLNWANVQSISDNCHGDAGYGFRRHVGAVWDSDYWLAVGRTYYGDNFCDSNFHDNPGKRLSESIEPSEKPIELSRRDTVDQVAKPAELSLRDVNPMDQGDGLHRAWFDENGILQVEFTPISEILAKHPHANVPAARSTAVASGRTWRGGSICDKRFQPYEAQVARPFAPPRRSTSSDINIASDLMFQGDGFYTATVDDSGTVDVEFTPMAELPPTAELLSKARAEGLLDYIPDSTDSLHKGKTECEGRDSGSQSDLDGANIQLAHNGDVTSRKCGAAAYGWDHRYVVQGRSFAVGRTFHGNNFCTDTFKGWHAARAVETPSGESASVDTPTVQFDLHANASTWDMTSAQMDQGDGLYVASLDDETGQMAVKFTPITKLSSRASLADASSWDMTSAQMDQGDGLYVASFDDETGQMSVKFTPVAELSSSVSRASVSSNSAADVINALNKRQGDKTSCARGSSKNVADLDSANRQLAEAGSKTDLKYNRVGWVHINHETSYWCATKGSYNWRYPYDYFINQQTIVSNTCGGTAGYGWNTFEGYTVAPPLATDTKADWTKISVGRTVRGTSICTQKFIPPAAAATVESSDILSKRDSVKQTCRGGFSMNVSDLDYVNSEMAKYGDQLNLKRSPITWLHKSGETSYWCLSEGADGWTENYDYFINEQMKISSHCGGSAAYGWSHSRGYKKFGVWNVWTEFSVGRTFKGGSICRKGFVPPSAPASIEASPIAVAPRSATFDARNQGDGFYLETFNDAGESTIKFTPRTEFKPYDPAQSSVSENLAAGSIDALRTRYHHPTCRKYPPTKSGSWQDVDEANVQLGRQSNGVHFDARTRGWVTINKEIAYLCAWSAWEGTYDEVIAANVLISFDCGGSTGYGWDYENKKDLTIGRTWLGDHICKINTHRDESVHDESVAAHAVEPMRVRSDLLQQGDGLYYGTINEAGEKTVEFTPIAELAALLPAQSATTENVTATTTDTFPPNVKYTKYWCRGYSENTPDLDFANVALAAMWDNMYLGWHNYVSFVK